MTNQISLNHYMHTSFRPDHEYIDGEVRERNVGLPELFANLDDRDSTGGEA